MLVIKPGSLQKIAFGEISATISLAQHLGVSAIFLSVGYGIEFWRPHKQLAGDDGAPP
jgi:hypothetical protein